MAKEKILQCVQMGMPITDKGAQIPNHRLRGVFEKDNGDRIFFEFCTHDYTGSKMPAVNGWMTWMDTLALCNDKDWENNYSKNSLLPKTRRHIKATWESIFEYLYNQTGVRFTGFELIDHDKIKGLY